MTAELETRVTPFGQVATQATTIEQSRAVAEVQAAVVIAQQAPRSMAGALQRMRESCSQLALAERAFYRYPRAGETITGPSIKLATELARCFGNVDYGIKELDRDDDRRVTEMLAYAWDLETNARSAQTFLVPHARDTKRGRVELTELRDIYENNANLGARRLRERIFSILPDWFIQEAIDLCNKTIREGGGKPLATRIADAIKTFEGLGVNLDRLEQKVGRKSAQWNEHDVTQLVIVYKSLQRGEITLDDEFPPTTTTAADILEKAKRAKPKVAEPEHLTQPALTPDEEAAEIAATGQGDDEGLDWTPDGAA